MSSVFGLLATLLLAPTASLDLPVTGLSVATAVTDLRVVSAWDDHGGADWLVLDGIERYRVDVAGRTDGDCPLSAPDVRDIGGIDWVIDGDVFCRVQNDARLRVKRLGPPIADEDALLFALGDSFANRRVTSIVLPPPTSPVGGPVQLPVTGLALDLPGGALWRVAPSAEPDPANPFAHRDHDGLVRLVPALPEIQVVVRRHARDELESCAAMRRRLLAGGWVATETSKIEIFTAVAKNRFGGFESIAWCAEHPDALLDVRMASWPKASHTTIAALFSALARATSTRPPPPSVLARRDADQILDAWAVATGGISFGGPNHMVATEAGIAWAMRDGLAVTTRGRIGHDRQGLAWGTSIELGASVVMASDLALVLSLGWLGRRDALRDDHALGLTLELRRGWFAHHDSLRWALRITGINLTAAEGQRLAAPLEVFWQADLGGLVLGVSLRSAPVKTHGDVVELGLRVGWGQLWR